MRVLSLNHGPDVRSELFGETIREQGHELVEWELPTQGLPPRGFDAVLALGGAQNVGQEEQHPWLDDEYELLRSWVADGTPLFAICLGAQTLAHALGAWVGRMPQRQMGFLEVSLTEAGRADPVLGVLPERFEAFVGNDFGFHVPDSAVLLASSAPQPQAYRVGESAWAVQFHPESRSEQVLRWWQDDVDPPKPLAVLEQELTKKMAGWQKLGRELCLAFLAYSIGRSVADHSCHEPT